MAGLVFCYYFVPDYPPSHICPSRYVCPSPPRKLMEVCVFVFSPQSLKSTPPVLVEQFAPWVPGARVCELGSVCSLLSVHFARVLAVEGLLSDCDKALVYFASSLLQCFCSSFLLPASSSLAFQLGGEWKVQSDVLWSSDTLPSCRKV